MSEYLPEEVIQRILLRLKPKSLVKCRAVCKSWNSLIISHHFMSTHLQFQRMISLNANDPFFIRLFDWGEEGYTLDLANRLVTQQREVHLPRTRNLRMVGYCNGLLCFSTYSYPRDGYSGFVIWNPSIQKFFTIPFGTCKSLTTHSFTGFGFDSTTNNFKLLVELSSNEVELYSLNSNSWKIIAAPLGVSVFDWAEGTRSYVFVNGTIHLWGSHNVGGNKMIKRLLLGFDVGDEIFFRILLPEVLDTKAFNLHMCKFGESIALTLRDGAGFDIWVMKEYGSVGSESSWTKVLHLADGLECGSPRLLGLWNNEGEGQVLLQQMYSGQIVSVDLKLAMTSNVIFQGAWEATIYASIDILVESLVLLDKGGDMSHYNNVIATCDDDDDDDDSDDDSDDDFNFYVDDYDVDF